jgi:alpha-aminoadipic semialdehyde synthase
MMAVDILPTALPMDASTHFSRVLSPYLNALIDEYKASSSQRPLGPEELQDALDRATITKHGELMANHAWLSESVHQWRNYAPATDNILGAGSVRKKTVLMLGSGMVAGPAVDEICKRKDVELVVGTSRHLEIR